MVPAVGDVRGKGLMIGIELIHPPGKGPAPDVAIQVLEECRARGLLLGRGGLYGNVLRIAPPLSVTVEEAEEAAEIIAQALAAVVSA